MRIRTATQPNGLEVVLVEARSAPVVAIEVWVGAGSAHERVDQRGLAHVHEHMIFKGTARRDVGDIARAVEAAGGQINARTSFDYTVYHIEMASRFFEQGLSTLADALQAPRFDPDELARELEVIGEEIKRAQDSPAHAASQRLFEIAYRGHPYGRPIMGSAETVPGFDTEDVRAFFDTWYVPSNMTLVVVGDVELPRLEALVEKHFARDDWRTGQESGTRGRVPRVPSTDDGPRVALCERNVREASLHVAFAIPGLEHEDVPAIDVLAVLLGGTSSARLDVRICQELGLVNNIGAFAYTPRSGGLFAVSATFQDTRGVSTRHVVETILEETLGFADAAVSPGSVERARHLIECQTVYEKQTMRGLASKYGFYACVMGDLAAEGRYFDGVASVDVAEVREVARRYLQPERMSLVLLHPTSWEPTPTESDLVEWIDVGTSVEPTSSELEVDEYGVHSAHLEGAPSLYVEPDDTIPLVAVWLSIPGGKRLEIDEHAGISQLFASLAMRGTHRHSAVGLAEAFESMGGGFDVFAGHNTVSMSATFLSEHVHHGVELLAEILLQPALSADELARERKHQIEELRAQRDAPGTVAFRQLARVLYGEHPYARPVLGDEDALMGMERDHIVEFHEHLLSRAPRALSMVGDVEPELAEALTRAWLRWDTSTSVDALAPAPPVLVEDGPRAVESIIENREQAHVVVGFPGVTLDDDARYALQVMTSILSGQGGRLFAELRDKQSLAYSVGASNRPDYDRGYLALYIATSVGKLDQALRGLATEIVRLCTTRVSDEELVRAHRALLGRHDISLQRRGTRASLLALNGLYGFGHNMHRHYSDNVLAVDVDAVREVAETYLRPERAVVSIVHPGVSDVPWKAFSETFETG